MSVVRVNKNKDYTVMSNCHLREKNMSLKAKGLLSLMLSLPDSWDYSIAGLVAICKESKTAIQNTLKELEIFKYLKRTRKQNEKGQFDYIYDIFEQPQDIKPQTENLVTDNLFTDNQLQLNTKELNTKELNTKKLKKVSKGKSFDEIIKDFCNENKKLEAELKKYLKMRFTKEKRLSNASLEEALNKLLEVSEYNEADMIEIVNKAVRKGQLDFYPLSEKEKQSNIHQNSWGDTGWYAPKTDEDFELLMKSFDKEKLQ